MVTFVRRCFRDVSRAIYFCENCTLYSQVMQSVKINRPENAHEDKKRENKLPRNNVVLQYCMMELSKNPNMKEVCILQVLG